MILFFVINYDFIVFYNSNSYTNDIHDIGFYELINFVSYWDSYFIGNICGFIFIGKMNENATLEHSRRTS